MLWLPYPYKTGQKPCGPLHKHNTKDEWVLTFDVTPFNRLYHFKMFPNEIKLVEGRRVYLKRQKRHIRKCLFNKFLNSFRTKDLEEFFVYPQCVTIAYYVLEGKCITLRSGTTGCCKHSIHWGSKKDAFCDFVRRDVYIKDIIVEKTETCTK